jgi:hypothetical protein
MLDRTRCQTLLDAGRAVLRPLHDLSSPWCRRVGVDIARQERPPSHGDLPTHARTPTRHGHRRPGTHPQSAHRPFRRLSGGRQVRWRASQPKAKTARCRTPWHSSNFKALPPSTAPPHAVASSIDWRTREPVLDPLLFLSLASGCLCRKLVDWVRGCGSRNPGASVRGGSILVSGLRLSIRRRGTFWTFWWDWAVRVARFAYAEFRFPCYILWHFWLLRRWFNNILILYHLFVARVAIE